VRTAGSVAIYAGIVSAARVGSPRAAWFASIPVTGGFSLLRKCADGKHGNNQYNRKERLFHSNLSLSWKKV